MANSVRYYTDSVVVSGRAITLRDDALVLTEDSVLISTNDDAVYAGSEADIYAYGEIYAFDDGIQADGGGESSIYVDEDAIIQASDGDAIRMKSGTDFVLNYGRLTGDSNAVRMDSTRAFLENHGSMSSRGDAAVHITARLVRVTNFGDIAQLDRNFNEPALRIEVKDDAFASETINYGSITTLITTSAADGVEAVAILGDDGARDEVRSYGEIIGNTLLQSGDDLLVNTGTITGDVKMGLGNDTVRNSGLIEGTVDLGEGDDLFRATQGGETADAVSGGEGDDKLVGASSDDALSGGKGSDILSGRRGDDVILGQNGGDTIDGGRGDDLLTGGGSKDVFVFRPRADDDEITDFANGTDKIDISAFGYRKGDFNSDILPAISSASDTASLLDLTAIGGDGSVLIEGLAIGDVDSSDFIFS